MTSRWKISTETKRSFSINNPKPFTSVSSPRNKLSMLSSFPFRYPFASDGCTASTASTSPQHSSPNASSLIAEEGNSSSLSGRYCSGFESGSNEEILFTKRTSYVEDPSVLLKKTNSEEKKFFYVNKNDDFEDRHLYDEKPDVFIESFRNDKINHLETVQSEVNFANLYGANTLPNKDFDESSGLKRYGVRRHHSAPQPDAKWLQVS